MYCTFKTGASSKLGDLQNVPTFSDYSNSNEIKNNVLLNDDEIHLLKSSRNGLDVCIYKNSLILPKEAISTAHYTSPFCLIQFFSSLDGRAVTRTGCLCTVNAAECHCRLTIQCEVRTQCCIKARLKK